MEKVLIAVDDTKGSKNVLDVFSNLVKPPREVLILHVQKLEGKSLMIDMLSDHELATLKESLEGTEYKEKLDRQTEKILNYYRKEFENTGLVSVRTLKREGIPSDEILKVAEEESVDLIVVGGNGKRGLNRLITGCVSKYVERNASVPVIVEKPEPKEAVRGIKGAVAPQFS
ncbi:MAG: universal stress protein [Nitrospiraceae bacterium]|nr:MAG: universal stress protein [Nitrospiraceae bacterium]UCH44738.1 MAG: universal stress protein [Nitrospiraceae bacterium]